MLRQIQELFYSVVPKTHYLTYKAGSSNVVISAPHGGGIRPFSIPPRKGGVQVRDTYSRRLTELVVDKLYQSPSYIISDIHRSRVDLNRSIEEAAEGNPKAEAIWREWDGTIRGFLDEARERNPRVLYVDIHSHDDNDTFELGYNLSASDYLRAMRGEKVRGVSTFDSIPGSLYQKLFGPYSFKHSLELMGLKTFIPNGTEVYFNGGRNVEVYSGEGVAAIQIEAPWEILHKDLERAARAIRFAIDNFCYKYI